MELVTLPAIVYTLVEVIKRTGLKTQYAPVVSVLLGIAMSFIFNAGNEVSFILAEGIVVGLTASGLYAGAKKTFS